MFEKMEERIRYLKRLHTSYTLLHLGSIRHLAINKRRKTYPLRQCYQKKNLVIFLIYIIILLI